MELDELLKQSVGAQGGVVGTSGSMPSVPTALPARKPPAPYIPPPRHDSGPNAGIGKVSYKHEAIIDFIIAHPGVSQNEIARQFDYSTSWISQMISSDAFQVRLAERSGDIIDPILRRDRDSMFKALLDRSYEVLTEKMALPSNTIPDQLAMRVMEISSRAIGYGARDPATLVIQQNNSIDVHLERMGEGLTKLLRSKRSIIEQETDE